MCGSKRTKKTPFEELRMPRSGAAKLKMNPSGAQAVREGIWVRGGVRYKVAVIAVLLAIGCSLVYYFHRVLGSGTVFSHFFYIPIVLACLWWKRKGLTVAVFSSACLILSHIFLKLDVVTSDDYFRAGMFMTVALIVTVLSECAAKVEEKLERYQFMVESAHDAIFFKDLKGRYIIANDRALEAFGLTREQVIGRNDNEIMPNEAEARKNIEDDQLVFKTGRLTEITKQMTDTDGKERWFQAVKVPRFDDKGNIIGLVGIARDITEHKKAEEELRDKTRALDAILANLKQGIAYLDKNDTIVYLNRQCADLFGLKYEDVFQKNVYEFHPSKKQEAVRALVREFKQGRQYLNVVETVGNKVVDNTFHRIQDDDGNYQGILMSAVDITERKQAEETLRREKKRAEEYLSTAGVMLAIVNADENITMINKKGLDILGYEKGELIGSNWFDTLVPERIKVEIRGVFRKLMAGNIEPVEYYENPLLTKNGEERAIAFHNTVLRDSNGRITGVLISGEDITERKKAEEQLQKARKELEIRVQQRTTELRQSEERFKLAAESTSDLIYEWDVATDRLDWFGDIDGALGFEPGEFPRTLKAWVKRIHPDDQARLADSMERCRESTEPVQEEYRIQRKNGTWRYWAGYGMPVLGRQGHPQRWIGACVDITDSKKAQEALKKSEEHYRIFASYQRAISELRNFYMVDTTFEQMIQKTLDLIIKQFGYYMAWYAELVEEEKVILPKLWAGRYEKYLDGLRLEYEGDERDAKCAMSLAILTKKPFGYADLEHDKDFEKWRAFALQYGYRSNQAIPLIIDGKCKSAFLIYSTRPFAFSEKSVEYLKGIVDELATIITNVSERKRAEQKFLGYQKQLRSLASELSLAEERLRRRIATDVHDHIGQNLAISKIKLDSLAQSISSAEHSGALEEIRDLVAQTIESARSLTFELSPPVLYDLGFEPAMEWLVRETRRRHGLSAEFADDGQKKPLDNNIRILLFQAVRELLHNVVKHAQARNVTVSTRRLDDEICVSVEDDGVGFNVSEAGSYEYRTGGVGLFSIRERLGHVGGRLDIESGPGLGTRISLVAPMGRGGESSRE